MLCFSWVPQNIRVGQLEVLAALSLNCGRYLASASVESLAIASKTVNKSGNQVGMAASLCCPETSPGTLGSYTCSDFML